MLCPPAPADLSLSPSLFELVINFFALSFSICFIHVFADLTSLPVFFLFVSSVRNLIAFLLLRSVGMIISDSQSASFYHLIMCVFLRPSRHSLYLLFRRNTLSSFPFIRAYPASNCILIFRFTPSGVETQIHVILI